MLSAIRVTLIISASFLSLIHQTSPHLVSRFRGFAFVTLGSVGEAQVRILEGNLSLKTGKKGWKTGSSFFLLKNCSKVGKGWRKKRSLLDTFVVLKGSKRLFWILLRGCLMCFRGFRLSCCWCCWRFQAIFSNYDNNMYNGRWAASVKIRWQQDHRSARQNVRHKGTVKPGHWYLILSWDSQER